MKPGSMIQIVRVDAPVSGLSSDIELDMLNAGSCA